MFLCLSKAIHLLEALAVLLRGHDCGEEQLHVTDGLLHSHVKHAQQGAPLVQHLPGGRRWEVPGKEGTGARAQGRHADGRTAVDVDADMSTSHAEQLEIKDATYSLQLLIKAFKTWSTELQISRKRRREWKKRADDCELSLNLLAIFSSIVSENMAYNRFPRGSRYYVRKTANNYVENESENVWNLYLIADVTLYEVIAQFKMC